MNSWTIEHYGAGVGDDFGCENELIGIYEI